MNPLLRSMLNRAVDPQKIAEENLKEYLRHVDVEELQQRISRFRDLDFKRMSSTEISEQFMQVMLFNIGGTGKISSLPICIGTYPKKHRFFRVRRLNLEQLQIPVRGMEVEADAWEAPAEYVRSGRLNKDGESLLYTSPGDLGVAIEETRIADGEMFAAIVYEAKEPIKCVEVGISSANANLTPEERIKVRMVLDFLRHEFIREVGQGTEHLYRISESLVKDHFDLPEEVSDGWCYPSVAKKGKVNVCFRPHVARRKLSLLGVMVSSARRLDDEYEIKTFSIAHGFDQNGKFIYHHIGSAVQRKIFPEIVLT